MNIEHAITLIEKAMVQMYEESDQVPNPYLAGYVDALGDAGLISEEERHVLYVTYAENGIIKGIGGPDIKL